MNQTEALIRFIGDLNSLKIPYMITGAYAVSYFGLPRATHDLDIVVEIMPADIAKVCRKFAKEYIVDKDMVENAVRYSTHFSIVRAKGDLKVDFWVLKDKANERARFKRCKKISLFGESTHIISAEDMILTKLEWFKRSKNTKHFDDVVGIIKIQAEKLDMSYITGLLDKLGIKKYWQTAVEKAKQS